jgi:hypothetical protein
VMCAAYRRPSSPIGKEHQAPWRVVECCSLMCNSLSRFKGLIDYYLTATKSTQGEQEGGKRGEERNLIFNRRRRMG